VNATEKGGQKRLMRGTALLMVGRVVGLLINFSTQLLIVRSLVKADYGMFAFALGFMETLAIVATFNLGHTTSRLAPRYEEEGRAAELTGAVYLMTATVFVLGGLSVLGVHLLQAPLASAFDLDDAGLALVLCLIWLTPVQAFDSFVIALLATLANARSIFVRRHLLGPLIKLAAVLAVLVSGGGVAEIAYAHLAAGLLGLALNVLLWAKTLRNKRLLVGALSRIRVPFREVFGFAAPLLLSDIAKTLRGAPVVVVLGYFCVQEEVAAYRSVFSLARLNEFALVTFSMLFAPMIARLQARQDWEELRATFWRASLWVTVLSFPLFAVSVVLAEPVTVLLFGDQYEGSAEVLAALVVGYFMHSAMGLSDHALRTLGAVRLVVALDVATGILTFVLLLALVPTYGAFGAAASVSGGGLFRAVAFHVALRQRIPLGRVPIAHLRLGGLLLVLLAVLIAVQRYWHPPLAVGLALHLIAFAVALRRGRKALAVSEFFPELARIRILRWLL
tara:strand:+ start:3215 stop:4729 length:1515 start_codon:yes stop_codon:yes gene_type:complete